MVFNLVYMAKPIYGGWVTMTAHLSLKYDYPLYKITKRTEKNNRNFGYSVKYQNMNIEEILKLDNILITALDKHYYEYLDMFPDNTNIIMHDPNDYKNKDVLNFLKRCNVFTIRESVENHLQEIHNIKSIFKYHPFYEYDKNFYKNNINDNCISISRIDFDKHTDIILKANPLINDDCNKIQIYGKENRLYVNFKLNDLNFTEYWKGKYDKTLPMSYDGRDMLNNCKYVIDMSIIKNDGGGTQYTFLEAIYHDCILILHKEWVEKGELFKDKHNCYVIGYTECIEQELADIINKKNIELDDIILKNSKEIMLDNINVSW